MAGYIDIVFSDNPTGGSFFITAEYLNSSGNYVPASMMYEAFKPVRSKRQEVTIGDSITETVVNTISAINLDYGDFGGKNNVVAQTFFGENITDGLTGLRVRVGADNWRIKSFSGLSDADFQATITNGEVEIPKYGKMLGYDEEASNCTDAYPIFEAAGGTGTYIVYIDGVRQPGESPSPVSFKLTRGKYHLVTIRDTNDLQITRPGITAPRQIVSGDITVTITHASDGAIATADVTFISKYLLPLEFSLDGINYKEENTFSGLTQGNYTIYVKDAFGCVSQKVFYVGEANTITEVLFEDISIINPIRFAKVEADKKKNRYNTLSYEQNKPTAYPYTQLFTDEDSPVTQIKTNAQFIEAFAVSCDGVQVPLNVVKRTNNIGIDFMSSATKTSYNGLMALRFGAIDIYDPVTGEIIDSQDLGYQIPVAFDSVGRVITIDDFGSVPVANIQYDENYESFLVVFNVNYTGADTPVIASAKYNVRNTETYEFLTPMVSMANEFQIIIQAGLSEENITHGFISEKIRKVQDSDRITEIVYWNTSNLGEMNYATGIVHTLRLEDVLSRVATTSNVEGYNSDIERVNVSKELFDGEEYLFQNLSDEMLRKIQAVFMHDRIFVNNTSVQLRDPSEPTTNFNVNLNSLSVITSINGDISDGGVNDEIILPDEGIGEDQATFELEQALAAVKNKKLILYKR